MKPTIAYIAGEFPKRSETFVYREVRELRRRGWTVQTVTLNPSSEEPSNADDLVQNRLMVYDGAWGGAMIEGLTHPLRSTATVGRAMLDAIACDEKIGLKNRLKIIFQAMASLKLARALRQRDVKHIHAHFAHAPATLAMYSAMQLGIPFSFTGHANDLYQRRILLREKLSRAQFVSSISHEHAAMYRGIFSAGNYPIIRCGVELQNAGPLPQSLPTGEGALRSIAILCVARLVEKKGIDTLLHAAAQLHGDFQIIIAGDGPQRAQLEAIVAEHQLQSRVQLLGAVENDRVKQLMKECDLFALPCRVDTNGDKDGIPVVLMEAMAAGKPVLSGDLPAIRELVIPDQTGLLVEGTALNQVVQSLQRLLDTPALRAQLAQSGQKHVMEEFSLAKNVDQLEEQLLLRK